MQASDQFRSIRLLYKDEISYEHHIIMQGSCHLYKHQIIVHEWDRYTSIRSSYHIIRSSYHTIRSSDRVIWANQHLIIFFRASGWHWQTCAQMGLNGVQLAPFRPKLGQNDAPDLRIIFQTLLGRKNSAKMYIKISKPRYLFSKTAIWRSMLG